MEPRAPGRAISSNVACRYGIMSAQRWPVTVITPQPSFGCHAGPFYDATAHLEARRLESIEQHEQLRSTPRRSTPRTPSRSTRRNLQNNLLTNVPCMYQTCLQRVQQQLRLTLSVRREVCQ